MPKSKVGTLEAVAQYIKNKLPQTGFFSTLDELIGQAPFEKAPFEQWKNYLQPGRSFEREGVKFPLKKEELDYTFGNPHATDVEGDVYRAPSTVMTKDELRDWIRERRPDFSLRVGAEDPHGVVSLRRRFPEEWASTFEGKDNEVSRAMPWGRAASPQMTSTRYSDYAHEAGLGAGDSPYEESATRSTDFGPYNTHFGPDVISHSRTTIQPTPEVSVKFGDDQSVDANTKLMRLIEEIQSDRHQAAAEKIRHTPVGIVAESRAPASVLGSEKDIWESSPVSRRGYRTPAEEQHIYDLQQELRDPPSDLIEHLQSLRDQLDELKSKIPDAPFKDPADYGLLELKQQMLNAAKQGQDYLGLIRGEDVSKRFGQGQEEAAGTSHVYDKVYPSVMKKLAQQYGIEMRDVPTTLKNSIDTATPTMREFNIETPHDLLEDLRSNADLLDPNDIKLHLDRIRDVITELQTPHSNAAFRAENSLDNLSRELLNHLSVKDVDDPFRGGNADVTSWYNQLADDLGEAHGVYADKIRKEVGPQAETKSFPAMVLTPELREKIKRIGVPIWALAGTAAGLAAQKQAEGDDMGYADGGKVRTVIDAIKRFAPMKADREEFRATSGGPSATLKSLRAALEAGQTKRDALKAEMEETRPDWMGPVDKAEGGGIDRLKHLAENVGTKDTIDRRKRILKGLASQWYGINSDSGEPEFLGGDLTGFLPFVRSWRVAHGQPAYKGVPGIFDESRAMLVGTPQAKESDERIAALKEKLSAGLGVGDPHGFGQNFDEALGTMLGQLPVPAKGPAKAGQLLLPNPEKVAMARKILEMAKKVPGAFSEWMNPTVDPKMMNYLTGATAGGALGTLSDSLTSPPVVSKAEGGAVKTEGAVKPIHEMLDTLRARLNVISGGTPDAFEEREATPADGSRQAQPEIR